MIFHVWSGFQSGVESILRVFWFCVAALSDWFKMRATFSANQVKLTPIVTCSNPFWPACVRCKWRKWCILHVVSSSICCEHSILKKSREL